MAILMNAAVCAAPSSGDGGATEAGPAVSVVNLGASFSDRGGWQPVLQLALEAKLHRPVSVNKVAKGGATVLWGLTQVQQVAAHTPDAVTVDFVGNDSDIRNFISLDAAGARTRELVTKIRDLPSRPCVFLIFGGPVYGVRAWLRPMLKAYERQYQQFGDQRGVQAVDLWPRFAALTPQDRKRAFSDGLHLTEDSYRTIVVPALAEAIGGAIEDRAGCR